MEQTRRGKLATETKRRPLSPPKTPPKKVRESSVDKVNAEDGEDGR